MATYKQIREFIKDQNDISIVTGWIADIKERCGIPMRIAHNRINPSKRVHPCPPNKVAIIKNAFRHFGMIK